MLKRCLPHIDLADFKLEYRESLSFQFYAQETGQQCREHQVEHHQQHQDTRNVQHQPVNEDRHAIGQQSRFPGTALKGFRLAWGREFTQGLRF